MNKNKLLLFVSITSTCAVAGTVVAINRGVTNTNAGALNRGVTPSAYTLTLDSHNQLDTDDGDAFYSLTTLGNKVYFGFDDTIERNPENGWVTLVSGGILDNPTIWNTNKITGMKSISIDTDYDSLKMYYGCELDGEIAYSNRVDFDTTDINYTFTPGYEPSYIKIEGYVGTNPNLLKNVVIEYSCSESDIVPTEILDYEPIEGKDEYRITGFIDHKESFIGNDLIIPSVIGDEPKPVTEIKNDAFNGEYHLAAYGFKSITIPDSVRYIGARAFQNCRAVTKINMPSTTTWGDDAFLYCGTTTNANISSTQTEINFDALYHNPVLETITVAEGNPNYCSDENGLLYAKTYSDSNGNFGKTLLVVPAAKKNITIPNDVEYIPSGVFGRSTKAETFHVGSGVELIKETFKDCENLTAFTVDANNDYYAASNSMLCDKLVGTVYSYPRANTSTSLNMPSTVRTIEAGAFEGVKYLKAANLNDTTHIGEGAFVNMSSLENIGLASAVEISNGAFKNNPKLKTVTLCSNLQVIPQEAFMNCTALESISLPHSLKTISAKAFKGCSALRSLSLPDQLLTTIGGEAFMNCTGLAISVTIPNCVTTLGNNVFKNSRITNFTFTTGIDYIPEGTFANCDSLTEITIPDHIETIGYDAFNDCDGLSRVTFTDEGNVSTIKSKAFFSCASLYKVYLPGYVTTIEASAFNQERLITIYAKISGLNNGEPFGWVKKPGWSESMCGAYYRLYCGDRAYYESH